MKELPDIYKTLVLLVIMHYQINRMKHTNTQTMKKKKNMTQNMNLKVLKIKSNLMFVQVTGLSVNFLTHITCVQILCQIRGLNFKMYLNGNIKEYEKEHISVERKIIYVHICIFITFYFCNVKPW